MAAQKKSHRGRTGKSKIHCLLPPALSQVRGKMEDEQHTENPFIVSFCNTVLWLKDQINFLPKMLKGGPLLIKDNYKKMPLVPDIFH